MHRLALRASLASMVAFAASSFLLAEPAAAQETGNFCVRDYTAGAGCTANDVRIEELTAVDVVTDCVDGNGTATIVFEMLVSADGSPDRYDIGAFLALDGGSALSGDNCFHDFLAPPLTTTPTFGDANMDMIDDIKDGPWSNLEPGVPADMCGDIDGGTQVIKTLQQLQVACVDNNLDGSVDVSVCSSWDNNTSGTCTGVTGAFPGTNSKCGCTLLELGIPPVGPPGEGPAIDVEKTPPEQNIRAGEDAVFTILVANTGDQDLINVMLVDTACDTLVGPSGDNPTVGTLETGETWSYTCTVQAVTTDFVNDVSVSAANDAGAPVSDTDSANVVVIDPSIDVQKSPPTQDVVLGADAVFTITVDNTGNADLENVIVTDVPCTTLVGPSGDDGDGILAIDETWTYVCTVENLMADLVNVVDVTATPPLGGDVSDSATATATVVELARGVPTLSGWSLAILAALVAGVGMLLVLRSRAAG